MPKKRIELPYQSNCGRHRAGHLDKDRNDRELEFSPQSKHLIHRGAEERQYNHGIAEYEETEDIDNHGQWYDLWGILYLFR